VVVDWGRGHGKLPCKMWGFLDLSNLPLHRRISVGGLNNLPPGIHAAVEASVLVENAANTELIRETQWTSKHSGGAAIASIVLQLVHNSSTKHILQHFNFVAK